MNHAHRAPAPPTRKGSPATVVLLALVAGALAVGLALVLRSQGASIDKLEKARQTEQEDRKLQAELEEIRQERARKDAFSQDLHLIEKGLPAPKKTQ